MDLIMGNPQLGLSWHLGHSRPSESKESNHDSQT